MPVKVLVVGSGGREHALAWSLRASGAEVQCAPGNAGTAEIAENLQTRESELAEVAARAGVDLTIVGPEAPLADGLADRFTERGLRVFGPSRAAARIEASKVWAKELLRRHAIPTARAEVVETLAAARRALGVAGLPAVVKADGLAGGKGVWVVHSPAEAEAGLEALFERRTLGKAGDRVLIEELLLGRELSVLAFTDGERLAIMPPARDHKRLLDGDRGPNTGGMGGYTRPTDATPELLARVEHEILRPTLRAMAAEGCPFRGVLYAGLMLTREGPKVLEFNCRFGDPEAQLILPLLLDDLAEVCGQVADGRLAREPRWRADATFGVVLAAPGYPEQPLLGDPIEGLDQMHDVLLFQAGTRREGEMLVTAGGRVLSVVARAPQLEDARRAAYAAAARISFPGKQLRTDMADPQSVVAA